MSIGFEESQGHQFIESRAHQRNGGYPTDPPPPFTVPYARQVVAYCPWGGWGPWAYDQLIQRTCNPAENEGLWDGWMYGVDQALEAGNSGITSELRAIPVNLGEWNWPNPSHSHYHKRVWRIEISCSDPRMPISGAFYQRTERLHIYTSDNDVGGTGDVELKVETDAGVLYHRVLGDDGHTTVAGSSSYPTYYEWRCSVLDEPYSNGEAISCTIDSTSGRSVEDTLNVANHWFDPPVYYTIKKTMTLMGSEAAVEGSGTLVDPLYCANLLAATVDLRDPDKFYDIYDNGVELPPVNRKMARTECLATYWQPPVAGAGDPPADGNPLRQIIVPGGSFAWGEEPAPYPPWDTQTGVWNYLYTPPEYAWLPVSQDLQFSTGAYAGQSLVGLLPGRYMRRAQESEWARPATASPDNGYETRKKSPPLDFLFNILTPTEKYYGCGALTANSITWLGDL